VSKVSTEGGGRKKWSKRDGYPRRESSGPRGRHKSQVNSRTAASFIPETSKAVGESGS